MGLFGGVSNKEKDYIIELLGNLSNGNLTVSLQKERFSDEQIFNHFKNIFSQQIIISNFANALSENKSEIAIDDKYSKLEIVQSLQKIQSNITEIKEHSEQQQREIDTRMKLVDEMCIVSETDLRGYITYVNDLHCSVSQYTREELMGQNQNIVRHPDMDKAVFKELWATVGRGQVFRGPVKNRKKDGTPYYVDGVFAPVLGANGKPVKYIGVRYENTEQTFAQQAAEGVVNAINTSFAFIEFDPKGNIITANDNFLHTLGYSLNEIVGKHHRMFVEPSFANSPAYMRFWEELAMGIPQNDLFKRITRQGNEIWIQAVYSPVKDEMGRITKVVKIATDVTAATLASHATAAASQEVTRVLSALSNGDLSQKYSVLSEGELSIK
ncbi:MAG: PAS domain-containing protein [Fluviicola sp.]|nr:PAS domain-containing protein [Fluviicola sp.]